MISIAKPLIGEAEKKAVAEVLDSGMIANGAIVTQFENEFAAYLGAKYAVATTSGTTGWVLHVDPETGVKGRFWTQPIELTSTDRHRGPFVECEK